MFAVELTPPELQALEMAFGIKPALLYDPWKDYTGVCVWEVNRVRTYALPGEPEDARYRDLGYRLISPDVTIRRGAIRSLLLPEQLDAIDARTRESSEWDSETIRQYADRIGVR